jgi:hypothetical protein
MANIPDNVKVPLNEMMEKILRSAGANAGQTAGIDWAALWDQGTDSTPTFGTATTAKLTISEYTDNSDTAGDTTISKTSGRAAIASGASACVVTNTLVTATSKVLVQLETAGAGVANLVCVPTANTITVTSVNGTGVVTVTTADCKFSFIVIN